MNTLRRAALSALSPKGARARLMIFAYHRVKESPDSVQPGIPCTKKFEQQLQWISRYCNPLPLTEAVQRLSSKALPPRALSVTFDDGYADNLELAAPLLRKYNIPATVFVAVDAVQRGIMWNDVLIEAVRAADGEIDASEIGLGRLRIDDSNRPKVVRELIGQIKYHPPDERLTLSHSIYAAVSRKPIKRQMLRPEQLRGLIDAGIDIGAHTVNHPILSMLDDAQAHSEILESRAWLYEQTGYEPRVFAYPNGKRNDDYTDRDVDIVRSLGFLAAMSSNWGCASSRSSLFELPRFKPWENTAHGFHSRLCKVALQSYFS